MPNESPNILKCLVGEFVIRAFILAARVKDGFHDFIVGGVKSAVDIVSGSKCAAHFVATVPAKSSAVIRMRLFDLEEGTNGTLFGSVFDRTMEQRIRCVL